MSCISLNPDDPVAGSPLEICYDFSGASFDDTTLTINWTPPGTPSSVSLSRSDNCETITVPSDATDVAIIDDRSHCSTVTRPVAAPGPGGP